MTLNYSPPSTYYDNAYHSQSTYDPLSFDELLSQFLFDPPNVPAIPTPPPTVASTSVPVPAIASPPAPAPTPGPGPGPHPHLVCHWVSRHSPPHICGEALPQDPRRACEHFRLVHDVRGNDKVIVGCHWYGCRATPMQRGSLVRHVLAVHLGLLRWRCETCGKVFSRKGTGHICGGGLPAGA